MRRRRVGRHSRPGCRNTCPGEARATPEPPDRRPLPEVPVLPAAARFAPGSDKRQAQRGGGGAPSPDCSGTEGCAGGSGGNPRSGTGVSAASAAAHDGVTEKASGASGAGAASCCTPSPAGSCHAGPPPDAGPSAAEGLSCGSAERPMSCFSSAASACPAAA